MSTKSARNTLSEHNKAVVLFELGQYLSLDSKSTKLAYVNLYPLLASFDQQAKEEKIKLQDCVGFPGNRRVFLRIYFNWLSIASVFVHKKIVLYIFTLMLICQTLCKYTHNFVRKQIHGTTPMFLPSPICYQFVRFIFKIY